jgi:hypothetical protein
MSQKRAFPNCWAAGTFAMYSARSALRAGTPVIGSTGRIGLGTVFSEAMRMAGIGGASTGPKPPGQVYACTCASEGSAVNTGPTNVAATITTILLDEPRLLVMVAPSSPLPRPQRNNDLLLACARLCLLEKKVARFAAHHNDEKTSFS